VLGELALLDDGAGDGQPERNAFVKEVAIESDAN